MTVEVPSAEYEERAPDWLKIRDVDAGVRRVKEATTRYLPSPSGMNEHGESYAHYLARAGFFNGLGRAVQGLHGMVFRKEPDIFLPPHMADFLERATVSGRSLHRFARWTVYELLKPGRVGVLVDAPRRGDNDRAPSRAEARRLGLEPYLVGYRAEDILEARFDVVGGRRVPVRYRLLEHVNVPDPQDEFMLEVEERWRVLELVPTVEGNPNSPHIYQQRMFVRSDPDRVTGRAEIVQAGAPVVPRRADGSPWSRIPFVLIDADGEPDDGSIAQPPLLDLADKTIELYQTLADLRHGLFYLGFPQACVKGAGKDFNPTIGASVVWLFEDTSADAWFMSHDGRGLDHLHREREELRREIALLGARMLQEDRRQVEAADTARIHRAGETSVLQSLSTLASEGLSESLRLVHEWKAEVGEEPRLELNTDFMPAGVSPAMVREMREALAAGRISGETWWQFMLTGEVLNAAHTWQEELEKIREDESLPVLAGDGEEDDVDEEEEVA